MVIITGAAGFIGSCLVGALNNAGREDLILSDDFSKPGKQNNLLRKDYHKKVERTELIKWMENYPGQIDYVIHLGARTDTAEFNTAIFDELNLNYSKDIWKVCTQKQIPLIYASSAATYGKGEMGYDDDHNIINLLKPLNPYGDSKNNFDKWVLQQIDTPPHWYGLKFFNVYGPNEYHKNRMASVIFHAYKQMRESGSVKLFRSHRPDFQDGKQLRDFIYIRDVVHIIIWLTQNKAPDGIYNIGTGKARSFYDLASATSAAIGIPLQIEWIDIPDDIRESYQYFTEAKMDKLRHAGYTKGFYSLEGGIAEYVHDYLSSDNYF